MPLMKEGKNIMDINNNKFNKAEYKINKRNNKLDLNIIIKKTNCLLFIKIICCRKITPLTPLPSFTPREKK